MSGGSSARTAVGALKAAYPGGFAQSAHGRNGADVYAVGDSSGMIAFDVSAPYPDDATGWSTADLDKVIGTNVFVPIAGYLPRRAPSGPRLAQTLA